MLTSIWHAEKNKHGMQTNPQIRPVNWTPHKRRRPWERGIEQELP
jgi:hypothetical protein